MRKTTLLILLTELPALVVAAVFLGRWTDSQGWTGGAGSALLVAVAFFAWIGHFVVASKTKEANKSDDQNS